MIDDLPPSTTVWLRLQTRTLHGWGKFSEWVSAATHAPAAVPAFAPKPEVDRVLNCSAIVLALPPPRRGCSGDQEMLLQMRDAGSALPRPSTLRSPTLCPVLPSCNL